MSEAWNRIRGELVEIPGLVGDFLIEWGEALDRWTRRHRWSERDLAAFAAQQRDPETSAAEVRLTGQESDQ